MDYIKAIAPSTSRRHIVNPAKTKGAGSRTLFQSLCGRRWFAFQVNVGTDIRGEMCTWCKIIKRGA